MRSDTLFRFDNTFDVWTGTSVQDPLSGDLKATYSLTKSSVKGMVIPTQSGILLATREPLVPKMQVRNMVDRNGVRVFAIGEEDYVMWVIDSAPFYDAFGSITGHKSVLRRNYPTNREEFLTSLAGS